MQNTGISPKEDQATIIALPQVTTYKLKCIHQRGFLLVMLCLVTGSLLMKRLNTYLRLAVEEVRDGKLVYHPPIKLTKSGKPFEDVDIGKVRKLLTPLKPIKKEEIEYGKMQLVVVTAATAGYFMHLRKLVESVQKTLDTVIVVYDLGLQRKQAIKIQGWCNVKYKTLDLFSYPNHVSQVNSYAFKPIIVAEALKQYPAILWADSSVEFESSDFSEYFDIAKQTDGLAILHGTGHSIFAVTPQQMFDYFPPVKDMKKKECLVATAIAIFRTQSVIDNFIKWWATCALSESCIYSEHNRGCDFQSFGTNKWDKFGHCSRFDQSVMSILIENMYLDSDAPPRMQYPGISIKRAKGEIAHPNICDEPRIDT